MTFPTPRSSKMTDENEETWQRRHAQGKVSTPPLALAVRMIPTPTSETFPTPTANLYETKNLQVLLDRRERCKIANKNGNGFGLTLAQHVAVNMIPTPTASLAGSKSSHNRTWSATYASLENFATGKGKQMPHWQELWPTANDGRNATRKSGDFQSLTRSVMLPTPTCQDANNNGSTSQQNRNAPPLNAVVTNHDPAMRLNPEWVEELMGWPIGWTEAPQDSGPGSGKPSRE